MGVKDVLQIVCTDILGDGPFGMLLTVERPFVLTPVFTVRPSVLTSVFTVLISDLAMLALALKVLLLHERL